MKTNEFDKMIKAALSEEEAEFYNQLEDQSVPEMITGLYSGKMKWLNIMMTFGMLIVFTLSVFCIVQFFRHDDIASMLQWGFGALIFMNGVGMIKVMQFTQMDKLSLLKAMKRIELQVAVLADRIGKNKMKKANR